MKLLTFALVALCAANALAQTSNKSSSTPLKRDKKQTVTREFFSIDNPEEHHGHSHHHHPDAHFPNGEHHHHGDEQTDHTADHNRRPTVVVVRTEHKAPEVTVTAIRPAERPHPIRYASPPHGHSGHVHVVQEPYHDHSHAAHHTRAVVHSDTAHKAPPGYPSSDFTKYFAQYTSRGGDPKEAAHSYYRDHNGHLYNYDIEPENAAPAQVRLAHLRSGRLTEDVHHPLPDPLSSQRNYVAAGKSFHSRVTTGAVDSPSGKGPITGFYFGDQERGGKLLIGNTQLRF